ncbi:MAG: dienelactone hydrolase family protein [Pseudomonadota bacterium]
MTAQTAIKRAGPGNAARLGIVLVHGRGSSATAILDLLGHLGLPDIAAAAPEAPGSSWWPTSFLAPTAEMEPFVGAGFQAVGAAVENLLADGLTRDRIAIMGFSQGACLALEYAVRKGTGLHSVFGLSGGLVGTADAGTRPLEELYGFADKTFDYDTDLSGLPVYLGCHEKDPHIPLKRVQDSAAAFAALGADVEAQIFPGAGHGVMMEEIAAMRGRLNGT